jgi:thioredoxin 1
MSQLPFAELIKSDIPTLVDFHAEWCGPCKMMAPILTQLKSAVGSKARIIKVDVDKNPALANVYQIRGIPTFAIFKNGELKWHQSGMVTLVQLQHAIDRYRVR